MMTDRAAPRMQAYCACLPACPSPVYQSLAGSAWHLGKPSCALLRLCWRLLLVNLLFAENVVCLWLIVYLGFTSFPLHISYKHLSLTFMGSYFIFLGYVIKLSRGQFNEPVTNNLILHVVVLIKSRNNEVGPNSRRETFFAFTFIRVFYVSKIQTSSLLCMVLSYQRLKELVS